MVNRIVSVTVFLCALSLSACAPVSRFLSSVEERLFTVDDSRNEPKLTSEEILDTRNIRASGNARTSPDMRASAAEGYRWIPPVVQRVRIPAMIRGGVLIPTHEEYVIINDASYVIGSERNDMMRAKYRIPEDVEIVSPLGGSDVVMGIYRMNPVFADSTVIPLDKVSFLLTDKGMERVVALRNGEVAQVGNFLLTFDREKRDEFITAGVAEDGLKSIQTFSLARDRVLFLSNGYVLFPMFEARNLMENRRNDDPFLSDSERGYSNAH